MFGDGKTKLIAVSPNEMTLVAAPRARKSEESSTLAGIEVTLSVERVAVEISVVVWAVVETSNEFELLAATVVALAGGVTTDVRVDV